jgi:hypothetical protein
VNSVARVRAWRASQELRGGYVGQSARFPFWCTLSASSYGRSTRRPPAVRRTTTDITTSELARELGVPVQRVIEVARDHCDWYLAGYLRVPNHVADTIRTRLANQNQGTAAVAPPTTENAPRRRAAFGSPSPFPPSPPRPRSRTPWVRIADLPSLERLFARRYVDSETTSLRRINPDRLPPDVHRRIQREARSWGDQFFDDRETAAWLAIGVLDPQTAAQCRAAGISPDMLLLPFRIPGKAQHEGKLTLKQALDCQAASVEEIRMDLVRTRVLPGHARAS